MEVDYSVVHSVKILEILFTRVGVFPIEIPFLYKQSNYCSFVYFLNKTF